MSYYLQPGETPKHFISPAFSLNILLSLLHISSLDNTEDLTLAFLPFAQTWITFLSLSIRVCLINFKSNEIWFQTHSAKV